MSIDRRLPRLLRQQGSFLLAGLLILACPALALAAAPATPSQPAPPSGSFLGDVLSVVLPVVFVIAVLLAVLYFARRRYGLAGRGAALSIMQILPVGPRERIVLVRSRAGRVFAVGVSAHSLNLITELDRADVGDEASGDNAATDVSSQTPASANDAAVHDDHMISASNSSSAAGRDDSRRIS